MISLKNSLLFPVIQSVHLVGIALLVGSTVLIDLRLLDYALRSHDVAEIRRRFAPWMRAGLAIMLATGPVLFASDAMRYLNNPAFIFKMAVLLLALVFHFTIHRRTEKKGKLVGLIS